MAAIRYNIMRDDNIRKVDKIFYLIQEINRIINSECINIEQVKKFKNHIYIFVEDILYGDVHDGAYGFRFRLTASEFKSLNNLYGELRNLESYLKDNLGNILTDKLVNFTRIYRTQEEM